PAVSRHAQVPTASIKLNHLVERDRQVAHALSRRMIDRVGDRSRHADNADLAEALDAERIDDLVRLLDEDDVDVVHIGIHGHVVFGNVGVHDASEAVVEQRFLVQRHADAPDHAAHDLAVGGLWVEDAASGDGIDHAGHAYDAKFFIHLDLREDGGVDIA